MKSFLYDTVFQVIFIHTLLYFRITESFGPGMEGLQQPQTAAPQIPMQLKSPPKWLRKPCGASFGFGGKLVSFENPSQSFTNAQGVQQTKNLPQEIVSLNYICLMSLMDKKRTFKK